MDVLIVSVSMLDIDCLCVSPQICIVCVILDLVFFFQAEDGIRDLVRSRGLGDVYKRQERLRVPDAAVDRDPHRAASRHRR